jgi:outer membrane lipoprotein-sorting protein
MLKKTAQIAIAILLTAGTGAAQDLTLDQVLAKHYDAVGGLDNWQNVQTMRVTGRMTLMPGTEAPAVMTMKRPSKMRMEFTFQGMTGIQAYDGTAAWMVMPFMGKTEAEPMPPDMSKDVIEQADFDGPLMGYREAGHQIELLGVVDVEGTKAYDLKVTLKGGDVQHHFLDAEYFVPIKIVGNRTMQGNTVEYEQILSDYKDVGGLMIAHSIEVKTKGAPTGQVITIDNVELNVPVEDAIFTMPKAGQ